MIYDDQSNEDDNDKVMKYRNHLLAHPYVIL